MKSKLKLRLSGPWWAMWWIGFGLVVVPVVGLMLYLSIWSLIHGDYDVAGASFLFGLGWPTIYILMNRNKYQLSLVSGGLAIKHPWRPKVLIPLEAMVDFRKGKPFGLGSKLVWEGKEFGFLPNERVQENPAPKEPCTVAELWEWYKDLD